MKKEPIEQAKGTEIVALLHPDKKNIVHVPVREVPRFTCKGYVLAARS